ncbi:MAG: preprotein translocase subunit YajC [Halieaceae bacterium]|jgi:preprotein translocase subunit YajC|nr:preprotein translocase subunit YajC [Halieaceae bacterium]MEE4192852.1 preprotein translocase subunit YajC [Halieaceae bacterium]
MSLFVANAHAQAAGQPAPGGEMFQIVFLIGLFVLFYFIAIRPQRKRQKEHADMVSALEKGNEVITTSGILGKITRLEDNFVVLQVADNVELKFQRSYINAVLPKGTLKSI